MPKVGKWSEKGWQICCQKDRFFAQLAVFAVLIYWYPVRPSFWPVPVRGLHGDSPLQAQIFQPAGPPQGPKATPCSPWGGGDVGQYMLTQAISTRGGCQTSLTGVEAHITHKRPHRNDLTPLIQTYRGALTDPIVRAAGTSKCTAWEN